MNLTPDRWQRLSSPAKYRLYTRVTLQGVLLGLSLFWFVSARDSIGLLAVASSIGGVVVLQSRPELTGVTRPAHDRRLLIVGAAILIASWIAGLIAVHSGAGDAARIVGVFTTVIAALALLPFIRYRWPILVGLAVATTFGYGYDSKPLLGVVIQIGIGAFMIGTTAASLWTLRIVDDLDEARRTEAQLKVAEERLRFGRDLHDVVGRSFSAIAVKSELASRLATTPGNAERAAAEMDEVKTLAVESLEEMRALVRGYRGIALADEVAGAQSLLNAAGCRLKIQGSPESVPAEFHEAAAWVVREGTTNIVRHSSATAATLALGRSGLTIVNDGAPATAGEPSGLRGLADRLSTIGGTLDTRSDGGVFTLEVRWESA
ncbi:sensor histidine kinase [Gordonia hydrophobica]|uniref:Histidine kinase n=1 Tax=Gordonia hydrophobica TaxID=40516 RepID=A0ABZ2U5P6_9ACTN|nr:histidine kinase [Gordonia hydrophobica]MBM7368765.1 two-component system sensor histidine kinase DesK [Gordonia hydrophobica]